MSVDAEHAGQRPFLLLVDDEQDFLDMLAFRLEKRGLPCLRASSGDAALHFLDDPDLEVVLLDLNMPGLPGLEALRAIKEQRPEVEVLLLTGESDLSVAARGMRRGAGDYLLKPVDMPALLESLSKARQRVRGHKKRLRAADAGRLIALGSLAHGVGHEINNPLQAVVQGAEWLCELVEDAESGLPLPPEEVASAAHVIRDQAHACARITKQLLDLAHRARNATATADIAELGARIAARLRERARHLNVELVTEFEADLPLLPYSGAELEPVLAQLAANGLDALEALPEDEAGERRLTLALSRAGPILRIEARDTGEGIAPEHARRIYEPFFSTRPVGRGAGLGLTICHSIVTMLRGTLRHMPNTPRGTIMRVDLPLAPAPEKEKA